MKKSAIFYGIAAVNAVAVALNVLVVVGDFWTGRDPLLPLIFVGANTVCAALMWGLARHSAKAEGRS